MTDPLSSFSGVGGKKSKATPVQIIEGHNRIVLSLIYKHVELKLEGSFTHLIRSHFGVYYWPGDLSLFIRETALVKCEIAGEKKYVNIFSSQKNSQAQLLY